MTDNPKDFETESALPEDGEIQAESWQEDSPPEDDFHDHDEAAVGMGEEHLEETESYAVSEGPDKKKGTIVLLGTLGGIALVIGGLAYMQFSGDSGSSRSPAPVPMEALYGKDAKDAKSGAETSLPDFPVSPAASEADIAAIYNVGVPGATATTGHAFAVPSNAVPDSSAIKSEGNKASETGMLTTTPIMPPPMPETVAPASDKAPLAPAAPEIPIHAPPASQPAAAVHGAVQTQAHQSPSAKEAETEIESIKKALEQTSQQTAQLASRIEAVAPSAELLKAVSALESRLEQIERKLAETPEKKPEAAAPQKAAKKEQADDTAKGVSLSSQDLDNVLFPSETEERKEVGQAKTRQATTVSRPARTSSVRKTAAPKATSPKWVLRAATPDSAWVSKDAQASELQHVQVGDTLQGIGRIRSIEQSGDGWVVVGTQGRIR